MENLPVDHWVTTQQFTPNVHRDVYPAIDPSQPSLSQKGKVIIITGASQGIGEKGFVPAFAKTGPKAIILVARTAHKLRAVAETVAKEYPAVETLCVPTDISDAKSVTSLFEKIGEKYGHADVLVNNAGVLSAMGTVKDVDQAAWWNEMSLNVHGTFLMTQTFLKSLPTPETPARIITLTTAAAYAVFPGLSAYGMSKLAVLELMAYVAAENPNVVATAIHPGIVKTDMTLDVFMRFALDTPELVSSLGVWLAAWEGVDRSFLSGRYISTNWDVEDLVKQKEEIVGGDLLKIDLKGKFGVEQFEKK